MTHISFLICLAIPIFCLTFAGVMMLAYYKKGVMLMQRNFDFSASFNAYYLAGPNNLLTQRERPITHYAYAREACLATLIVKGLSRSFLCPMTRVP